MSVRVLVIALVDMWRYSQIDAALAISPISLMGLVVAPMVGRVADRAQRGPDARVPLDPGRDRARGSVALAARVGPDGALAAR